MSIHIAYVTSVRQHIGNLLNEVVALNGLRQQYTWEDLGNTLESSIFTTDLHKDITLAQFVSAITSFDAVITLLGQGHGTNLVKMRMTE